MYLWPLQKMRIRVSFRFRLRSAIARTQPQTYVGRGFRPSNLFPKNRGVERTLSPEQFVRIHSRKVHPLQRHRKHLPGRQAHSVEPWRLVLAEPTREAQFRRTTSASVFPDI